jgi:hypothetical protein
MENLNHLNDKRHPKKGMALVLVLALCTSLLVFGGFYIGQIRQQAPLNLPSLAALQAHFLAQGVAQVAALKVQKMPSHLFYAMVARNKGTTTDPATTFQGDTLLSPAFTTPFEAQTQTVIEMNPSSIYKTMNFLVRVTVNVKDMHGVSYQRLVEQQFTGDIQIVP